MLTSVNTVVNYLKSVRHWRPELLFIIGAALITRLWSLKTPNSIVFDEVYFKAFSAHYLDGHFSFDIHPPLGKLLLAGWANLLGLPADALLNTPATSLRYLPALAGVLLIPCFWGILRRLGASRPFAFLGALGLLADNALIVESRFILMDSMLLLFGLGALYWYLVARTSTTAWRWLWLGLAAVSAGAAVSIKWTGLTALALIGVVWLIDNRRQSKPARVIILELAVGLLVPILIYMGSFWLHFQLMPFTGDGDAFMSTRFQSSLIGNASYAPSKPLSFIEKFSDLNVEMYQANKTLTATHPYSSHWYTWPLEIRPIYYWQGPLRDNGFQGNIYLLGNPIVWWGTLIAAGFGLVYARIKDRPLRPATKTALWLTAGAYLINFVPFMAVSRVMFLYHYFYSFVFSVAFVVLLWNDLADPQDEPSWPRRAALRIYFGLCALIILVFWFFAPLSYGTALSPQELQSRMWLASWR